MQPSESLPIVMYILKGISLLGFIICLYLLFRLAKANINLVKKGFKFIIEFIFFLLGQKLVFARQTWVFHQSDDFGLALLNFILTLAVVIVELFIFYLIYIAMGLYWHLTYPYLFEGIVLGLPLTNTLINLIIQWRYYQNPINRPRKNNNPHIYNWWFDA